jgi:hypothetical protein
MNITIFWDIMPCSPLKDNRHFGGTYRLHIQDRISRVRYQREITVLCPRRQSSYNYMIHEGFILKNSLTSFFVSVIFYVWNVLKFQKLCKNICSCVLAIICVALCVPWTCVYGGWWPGYLCQGKYDDNVYQETCLLQFAFSVKKKAKNKAIPVTGRGGP